MPYSDDPAYRRYVSHNPNDAPAPLAPDANAPDPLSSDGATPALSLRATPPPAAGSQPRGEPFVTALVAQAQLGLRDRPLRPQRLSRGQRPVRGLAYYLGLLPGA